VQRLETAKLSESADRTGIVNFQIIEPPAVKFEPVSPKRTILLIGVLILGIGAAAALAYGANLLRPVFVSTQRLAQSTGVAVLGAVGHSAFEMDRARTRKDYLLFAAASLSLVGAFIVVTAFTLYDGGRLFEQLLH
jgi:hypothetical protein